MKSTIGERGQVVIPKRLRERFGFRAGQQVEFEEEDGRLLLTKVVPVDDPIARITGILKLEGWDTDSMIEAMRGPAELPREG
jgi:AbrB family looped-hinge helix DNA binding protein